MSSMLTTLLTARTLRELLQGGAKQKAEGMRREREEEEWCWVACVFCSDSPINEGIWGSCFGGLGGFWGFWAVGQAPKPLTQFAGCCTTWTKGGQKAGRRWRAVAC